MAKRVDVSQRIITAALALAAERRWRDISLKEIAARARVKLERLRQIYPSKTAILVAFVRRLEASVAADIAGFEPEDSARDRLFEVLMGCFDGLAKHRDAVSLFAADLPRDPITAIELAPTFLRSMDWALKTANISSAGIAGCLRVKGLAVVWLASLPVWLADDSPDQARTMAALDRNLRRAEGIAQRLWPLRTTDGGVAESA
jgi:AcrR family transcriptional regulator